MDLLFLSLAALLFIIMLLILRYAIRLKAENTRLSLDHQSTLVRHGKAWEDFVPFMSEFEKIASRENFAFLGMPIDGIAFDDDAIKFIEIKTGKSQLTPKQKRIRELVQGRKVEWYELRFGIRTAFDCRAISSAVHINLCAYNNCLNRAGSPGL